MMKMRFFFLCINVHKGSDQVTNSVSQGAPRYRCGILNLSGVAGEPHGHSGRWLRCGCAAACCALQCSGSSVQAAITGSWCTSLTFWNLPSPSSLSLCLASYAFSL